MYLGDYGVTRSTAHYAFRSQWFVGQHPVAIDGQFHDGMPPAVKALRRPKFLVTRL